MNVVKIRSSVPLVKVLEIIQRKRPHESCDTHVMCQDGYIPCHRYILMANSPFLKRLILDNLKETGNPDYKTVITLTFPDIKTAHMAQVIAMFYSGMSICKLEDLYYVMNVLKLIGLEYGEKESTHLKAATNEEIQMYCKLRYYIDPDSDSDEEGGNESTANQFTTNAFSALAQQNDVPEASQSAAYQRPGPSSSKSRQNVVRSVTTVPERKVEESLQMEVDSSAEDEAPSPAPEPVQIENPIQPKVTPISIKALMDKQIARKRRKPSFRKDAEEKDSKKESKSESRESTKSSSKDKQSDKKQQVLTKGKSDDKEPASDSDNGNSSSDDSVVGSAKRRNSLRAKKVDNEASRRTPVRKCRIATEGTPTSSDIPSALKKPNEAGGSAKKNKQVIFVFPEDHDNEKNRPKEVKCFYCSEIFSNEEALEKHLSEACGEHLKGTYSRANQRCNICSKRFPTLNLWGLIRHVDMCMKSRSSPDTQSQPIRKKQESQKTSAANPKAIKEKAEKVRENKPSGSKKPPPVDDDDVCSEEEIQVFDSLKVNIVRHVFKNSNSVEKEIKSDAIPEKLVASTSTNISASSSNVRQTQAPIVVTQALPAKIKSIILKYFERLRDCRFCMEPHSNTTDATRCLTDHGYTLCWVCFQTYDSPTLEDHYKDYHDVEGKPGAILCPLCKISCKHSNLHNHMNEIHFSSVSSTESLKNKLEIQPKDRKRKRDEDDIEKAKRPALDSVSSSTNDTIPISRAKKPIAVEIPTANAPKTVTTEVPKGQAPKTVATATPKGKAPQTVANATPKGKVPQTVTTEAPKGQAPKTVATATPKGKAPQIVTTEAPKGQAPKTVATATPKGKVPQTVATEAPKGTAPQIVTTEAPKGQAPKTVTTEAPKGQAPKTVATATPKGKVPQTVATEAPKGTAPQIVTAEDPKGKAPQIVTTEAPKGTAPQIVTTEDPKGKALQTVTADAPKGKAPQTVPTETAQGKAPQTATAEAAQGKDPQTVTAETAAAKAPQTVTAESPKAIDQNISEEDESSSLDNSTAADNDVANPNQSINWDKLEEKIQDYIKSKHQDADSGKQIVAVVPSRSNVIQENTVQRVENATSLVPTDSTDDNPTDMQLFLRTASAEPKLKVTPALVANRIFELMNAPMPMPSTSKTIFPVVRDDNRPSTSKAALMSPQKPLDYRIQAQQTQHSDFTASLTVPKIPALEQRNTTEKAKSSQPRGRDSIVTRNQQEPFRYTSQIRNPMPGDRLYCGTIAADSQNFRCFKVHPENAPLAARISPIQFPTVSQSNGNNEKEQQPTNPPPQ